MKLVCFSQMYNENTHKGPDGKTNLVRFMKSIMKYCDALVVYDDNSIDNSVDLIKSYDFEIELIEGKKNNFTNELAHKQLCLDKCREIGATHILWVDQDEILEAAGERGGIKYLCENMSKGAVNFPQVNFWRTDRYYRTDELWAQGLFCRLWKLTPDLHYDIKPGLHQDLAPKGIDGRDTTNLKVLHYGFANTDSILRKYYMYKSHGQKGRPLTRLVDENTLRVKQSDSKWFAEKCCPHGPEVKVYEKPLESYL